MNNSKEERKDRKKFKKALQKSARDRNDRYLTKKEVKFYRKLIEEKLKECGFSNELLPYRTGKRKFRPKIVDQPDSFVKDEKGNPVEQPAIQHVPVEMITYRNISENMTKRLLKRPVSEIEAFLALPADEFKRPEPKVVPKKGFFAKVKDFFKRKETR